jgi:hypothetical protein
LRSTETITGFKADLLAQASETKDQLVAKGKESVTVGAQDRPLARNKGEGRSKPGRCACPGCWACLAPFAPPPVASALVGLG